MYRRRLPRARGIPDNTDTAPPGSCVRAGDLRRWRACPNEGAPEFGQGDEFATFGLRYRRSPERASREPDTAAMQKVVGSSRIIRSRTLISNWARPGGHAPTFLVRGGIGALPFAPGANCSWKRSSA